MSKKAQNLGNFQPEVFTILDEESYGQNTSAKLMLATLEERLRAGWLAVCALRIAWHSMNFCGLGVIMVSNEERS